MQNQEPNQKLRGQLSQRLVSPAKPLPAAFGWAFFLCWLTGCSGASLGDANPPVAEANSPAVTGNEVPNPNDLAPSLFSGQIVINEVSSDGFDEVEFLNLQSEPVDLSGWSYADEGWVPGDPLLEDHRYVFPSGTMLEGGAYLVVRKDQEHTFGLSGDGDTVWLLDGETRLVDSVTWGLGEASPSLCRQPNGMGDFETCGSKTLGARNETQRVGDAGGDDPDDGAADAGAGFVNDGGTPDDFSDAGAGSRSVVINEVVSTGDDSIELKNIGNERVDVSGWWLADDGYDPADPATHDNRYVLPAGSQIDPGAYLILVKNQDHTFGLGADDAVSLYNDGGQLVDACDWEIDEAAISYCRIPDGTGEFLTCSAMSFGTQNIE